MCARIQSHTIPGQTCRCLPGIFQRYPFKGNKRAFTLKFNLDLYFSVFVKLSMPGLHWLIWSHIFNYVKVHFRLETELQLSRRFFVCLGFWFMTSVAENVPCQLLRICKASVSKKGFSPHWKRHYYGWHYKWDYDIINLWLVLEKVSEFPI